MIIKLRLPGNSKDHCVFCHLWKNFNYKHTWGNKLRTYAQFKTEFKTESYLQDRTISLKDRKAFAQVRCGVAPLRIETGRYDQGRYIPEEERICLICNQGIENELHLVMNCAYYNDIRQNLLSEGVEIYRAKPDIMMNSKCDHYQPAVGRVVITNTIQ